MFSIITAIIGAVVALGGIITKTVMQGRQEAENAAIATKQIQTAQEGKQLDLQMNQENIQAQKEINQANIENQNQQNAIMRAREDNAVQRRAADLQAAGINPLLAGMQGASAQAGGIAIQQAPIADTSIGSRFATNITNILDSLATKQQESRRIIGEAIQSGGTELSEIASKISQISKSEKEKRVMEAQYDNLNADTQKKFQEIVNKQKEVEKMTQEISQSKKQEEYIQEMITSEPVKRALMRAETKKQYENIKLYQQQILNLQQEKVTEVIKQSEILTRTDINREEAKKIRQEVENLILDGNIKEFQKNMLKLDKTTQVSKDYVKMFTDILSSIFSVPFWMGNK